MLKCKCLVKGGHRCSRDIPSNQNFCTQHKKKCTAIAPGEEIITSTVVTSAHHAEQNAKFISPSLARSNYIAKSSVNIPNKSDVVKYTPERVRKITPAKTDPLNLEYQRDFVEADEFENENKALTIQRDQFGQSIILKPEQVNHYTKLKNILNNQMFFLDTSTTGSGKTWTSMALAVHFDFELFVVAPKIVMPAWRNLANKTKVKIIDIISYNSLVSVTGRQPPNGYLSRRDSPNMVNYFPTPKLLDLWNRRVLFVFDEIHKVKNYTATMKAVSAFIASSSEIATESRIGLLSATLFDKDVHALSFFHLLGYVSPDIHFIVGYNYKSPLSKQVIDNLYTECANINKTETLNIMRDFPGSDVVTIAKHLFIKVVLPSSKSEMKPPILGFEHDRKRGVYQFDDESLVNLIIELNGMLTPKTYRDLQGFYQVDANEIRYAKQLATEDPKFTMIRHHMREIAVRKAKIVKRLVIHRLMIQPEAKVIVFTEFVETVVNSLTAELVKFSESLPEEFQFEVLQITGSNDTARQRAIELFNQPDEPVSPPSSELSTETEDRQEPRNVFRVLICSINSGGVGINLHDTVGNRPRYGFIIPGFSEDQMFQAAGRIYRQGLMSPVNTRIVYVANESGLMNSTWFKAMNIAEKNDPENLGFEQGKIAYPSSYPFEPETDEMYEETLRLENADYSQS